MNLSFDVVKGKWSNPWTDGQEATKSRSEELEETPRRDSETLTHSEECKIWVYPTFKGWLGNRIENEILALFYRDYAMSGDQFTLHWMSRVYIGSENCPFIWGLREAT